MTPLAGGTTLLLVGALLIRLTVTDAYQRYVRTGMGPWLLVAGVLLVALAGVTVVRALRAPATVPAGPDAAPHHDDDRSHYDHRAHDGHEHDGHEHDDRAGWLLLVPVLCLLLVAPPALGSFGVERSRVSTGAVAVFDPLPARSGPVDLTLLEFDQRALDRGGDSLRGVTVRLTGFVADPADGQGFRLARYQISCCAADAVSAVARVTGSSGTVSVRDAWYAVTGTFQDVGADGVPELRATVVESRPSPVDPYE